MYTYTIQRHQPSGEAYAIRYQDFDITGVCGPLFVGDWSDDGFAIRPGVDLADFGYETEDVEWAKSQEWGYPRN